MPIDTVLVDVGVGCTAERNPRAGVLANVIICNVGARVISQDPVCILHYLVLVDPSISAFYRKDALSSRPVYFIIDDNCVTCLLATVCNICLKVLIKIVLFDVCVGGLDQQNALAEVRLNSIIADID